MNMYCLSIGLCRIKGATENKENKKASPTFPSEEKNGRTNTPMTLFNGAPSRWLHHNKKKSGKPIK
jgi:hypothetical protein